MRSRTPSPTYCSRRIAVLTLRFKKLGLISFVMSSESKLLIVVGGIFLLFAIATAMGAVSYGTFNTPNSFGAFRVVNGWFELLAVVLAGMGGYFLYRGGKMKDAARVSPTGA